jgi:anti-sigma factor RsiW
MSVRHATAKELELYVLGALAGAEAEAVEAHCVACDACSAALAGEARLEIAFEQVARRPSRIALGRPLRGAAYAAAGVLAMAAAVLLWFGRAPAAAAGVGEGTASVGHSAVQDGAILDARNDALDGG